MNSTRTLLVTLTAGGLLVGAAARRPACSRPVAASAAGVGARRDQLRPRRATLVARARGPVAGAVQVRSAAPAGTAARASLARACGGLRPAGQGPVLHGEFVDRRPERRHPDRRRPERHRQREGRLDDHRDEQRRLQGRLDARRLDEGADGWSQGAVKDIAQGDTVLVEGTKSAVDDDGRDSSRSARRVRLSARRGRRRRPPKSPAAHRARAGPDPSGLGLEQLLADLGRVRHGGQRPSPFSIASSASPTVDVQTA